MPPPIVGKKGAEPLMARESTEARITQDGAERGLLRQRALMPDADCDQCGKKDDDPAKRDLQERQILWLHAQPK
jgi:hypothetical protein